MHIPVHASQDACIKLVAEPFPLAERPQVNFYQTHQNVIQNVPTCTHKAVRDACKQHSLSRHKLGFPSQVE